MMIWDMSRAGLSLRMRSLLSKIILAGDDGFAISNTNRTAAGLASRGYVERMERQERDARICHFRWRATAAGKSAFRPTDCLIR